MVEASKLTLDTAHDLRLRVTPVTTLNSLKTWELGVSSTFISIIRAHLTNKSKIFLEKRNKQKQQQRNKHIKNIPLRVNQKKIHWEMFSGYFSFGLVYLGLTV